MQISSYLSMLLLMAKQIHREKLVKDHLVCMIKAAILDSLGYVGYDSFQYLKLIIFKVSFHKLLLRDHQKVVIESLFKF